MNTQMFIVPQLLEGIGPINAATKKMAKQMGTSDPCEVFRRINSGEWVVVSKPERAWREQDSVIYFSVTSDGTTGEKWIERLESKGFRLSDHAKSVLRTSDFQPTEASTYEIAVLKGMLFEDNNRITKNIRTDADKQKLTKPNAEVTCLIREKFSDEELEAMGLWWIVAMHEPIKDSGSVPGLLSASRVGGGRWLDACYDSPDFRWNRVDGFAFVVSQVSA